MPYKDPIQQKEAQRRSYLRNKEIYKKHNQKRRKERKEWFLKQLIGRSCSICKEAEQSCLDFHHLDPHKKDERVSRLLNEFRSLERILAEMDKCILICSNCHRKLHAGILSL
jgi:hypothetical protein